MMRVVTAATLVAVVLAAVSSLALAQPDGTIAFTGRIVAPMQATLGASVTVTGTVRGESGNCRLIVHDVTHVWACWAQPTQAPSMGSIAQVSGMVVHISGVTHTYWIQRSTKAQP